MLTGVYLDPRYRGCRPRWLAVWKVGNQFWHVRVNGLHESKEAALFAAASQPPIERKDT